MPLPSSEAARLFYQAAHQRSDDADFLLNGDRTTGSTYLAGYSVECILKALILSHTPKRKHKTVLNSFRGAKAHDFEWLKREYLKRGGAPPPLAVVRLFALVNTWSTDIRYKPGAIGRREAVTFVDATSKILQWADGRM
jgi:HEPN domain-containing protein